MAYNAGASSGNLVLLSKQIASAASAINFTSVITTAYDDYVLRFNGLTAAGGGSFLQIQFSIDNGSSYLTGAVYTLSGYETNSGGQTFSFSAAQTGCRLCQTVAASPTQSCGTAQFFNISSGTFNPVVITQSMSTSIGDHSNIGTSYNAAIAVNAFRVIVDSGTFSGTFKLYGVAN